MLIEQVEAYLTGSDQRIDDELISSMWDAFEYSTKRQFMEQREHSRKLRGSNPGPCPRKMAYANLGYPPTQSIQARTLITFWTGDIIELVTIGLLRLAGLDVTNTVLDEEGQAEGFFEADDGISIPCHADGIVEKQPGISDRRLLEVKSSSDYGFKRQWKRGKIGDNYRLQHNVYMEAFGLEKGIFFIINKNTGHFHEVPTTKDPDFIEWAKKNYRWANDADKDNLPARFVDGENFGIKQDSKNEDKLCWGCGYCDFIHHCWPQARVEIERGKPVYYIDEKDDVPEITKSDIFLDEELELEL